MVDTVMSKIEEFFFSDGDDGGEKLFDDFAKDIHHEFDDDIVDAEHRTQKPE